MEHGGSPFAHLNCEPSLKYPTLELRAPDCCTRLDDTVAIAALYRSLARFLYRHPEHNAGLDTVDRAIAVENKWALSGTVYRARSSRAQARSASPPCSTASSTSSTDAEALGCAEQVENSRVIIVEGTSADAQLRIFTENQHEGAEIALHKVTRWIRDATLVA